jgi:hypothetical protein
MNVIIQFFIIDLFILNAIIIKFELPNTRF